MKQFPTENVESASQNHSAAAAAVNSKWIKSGDMTKGMNQFGRIKFLALVQSP